MDRRNQGWLPLATLVVVTGLAGLVACDGGGGDDGGDTSTTRAWIDTHSHPFGISSDCTSQTCVNGAIAAMDAAGVRKAIFFCPPSAKSSVSKESAVVTAASYRTDRLFYGSGGCTLQSLIDEMPDSGLATASQKAQFQSTFDSVVAAGPAAVVFGETASLHLSYEVAHAFEENPTDSDLFKLLADLAAARNRVIDIHIDVVPQTMPTPSYFLTASPNNPPTLQANIPALERLLTYNRNARIVLAHVGRDTTGQMTASLIDRLLGAHANLFAQIHPTNAPLSSATAIVDGSFNVRADWLALLQKYPDRFVVGSDCFYTGASTQRELDGVQRFLKNLSSDLATRIGCTNPVSIYRLSSGC